MNTAVRLHSDPSRYSIAVVIFISLLTNDIADVFMCFVLSRSVVSDLWFHGLWSTRLLSLWDFPGKNTGVGCHFLLQGIFPTKGPNLCLLHWQAVLYHWATWQGQKARQKRTKLSVANSPWETRDYENGDENHLRVSKCWWWNERYEEVGGVRMIIRFLMWATGYRMLPFPKLQNLRRKSRGKLYGPCQI